MAKAKRKLEPIRQSVRVDCPIDDAFRLFTERLAEWWPLAENCMIEPWVGGRVFERTRSGEERDWGSVIAWDAPQHLEISWDRGQTVDVEFMVEADGTRVTLLHTGWEAAGVLTCFSEFACAQLACAQLVLA